MRGVRAGLSIGLALAAAAGHARADEAERVFLVYAHGDVERCPSERELRDAVASRLGRDPFEGATEGDPARAEVQVKRRGAGVVGVLVMRGPRPGQREIASPTGDCREVVDALAVALAIGIDPGSLTRPSPPPVSPAVPQPLPPPALPPPPSVPPSGAGADAPTPPPGRSRDAVAVTVGAGPMALFGELPASAVGGLLHVGLRWRWLEPRIEGLATVPVTLETSGGAVTASLLAVGLAPCAHAGLAFGCVELTLGTLSGEGSKIPVAIRATELYASAQARAGIEIELSRVVALQAWGGMVAPLTRVHLELDRREVWQGPRLAARVGAAVTLRF